MGSFEISFIMSGIALIVLYLLHFGDSRRINLLELKVKKLEKKFSKEKLTEKRNHDCL